MTEYPSAFVPEGIDPLDKKAACKAAIDCANAVGQLLETAKHQRRGTRVTENAILRCLYDMDCAVVNASNFHACSTTFPSSPTTPCVEASRLADMVRTQWMKAIVEWKSRAEAPSDGWSSLWHLYAQHFGNQVGPTWADAATSMEKCDADEKGLMNTAKIYIPQEALEHHWHYGAWPFVCEKIKRFDSTDLTTLVQSLAELRDSFDEGCAKPTSEIVVFLETVRDEVHYAADAKRQQLAREYSNDTLASMVGGIKWAEAGQRVLILSELPTHVVEQVACVLRRKLTVGTVEQIDELFTDVMRGLRDALEDRESSQITAIRDDVASLNKLAALGTIQQEQILSTEKNQLDSSTMGDVINSKNNEPPLPINRPSDAALAAWRFRDLKGIINQTEIAKMLSKKGTPATQGQVSRWLKQVDEYLKAGNVLPVMPPLTSQPTSIDPTILDLGKRQDGRTPRQRERHDSKSDD